LLEYESKKIINDYGIKIPKGFLIKSIEDCLKISKKIDYPIFLKAQLPLKERTKIGGIALANNEKELIELIKKMINKKINNITIRNILIEEKIDIEKEFFIAITIDWSTSSPILLFSSYGGIDIEKRKEEVHFFKFSYKEGLNDSILNKIPFIDFLEKEKFEEFKEILRKLWFIFKEFNAEIIELNPLALSTKGELIAIDARIVLDDDALIIKKEFANKISKYLINNRVDCIPKERENFVELDGNIGVIGNGAGIVMATLDLINLFGGKPANFYDLGGGANLEATFKALEKVSSMKNLKCIIINVFGGMTKCDEIAKGIILAKEKLNLPKLYVRLIGENEEKAKKILKMAGIKYFDDMELLIKNAVKECDKKCQY
jgi:succinyl-CoA synthetase beta subunit